MVSKHSQNLVLALETGIGAGSFSIFREQQCILKWLGSKESAKFDNFLEVMAETFKKFEIDVKQIGKIVVSRGPGGYTGLRIGIALAKGLKSSLGVDLKGVSVLEAMPKNKGLITVAAVPLGKSDVCWQRFEKRQDSGRYFGSEIKFAGLDVFCIEGIAREVECLVLPESLYQRITGISGFQEMLGLLGKKIVVEFSDENFAYLIGRAELNSGLGVDPSIIYPTLYIPSNG